MGLASSEGLGVAPRKMSQWWPGEARLFVLAGKGASRSAPLTVASHVFEPPRPKKTRDRPNAGGGGPTI